MRNTNVKYRVADIATWPLAAESFDCIVTIATLHHLSSEVVLPKVAMALKVGGVLVALDLVQADGVLEWVPSGIAVPVAALLKLLHTGR
jgi:SAM-dependent methyltransferase